ncbi:MAG: hypothetical protein REI78_12280 [Pedobacter sp.]|nr:hypothetical protein [Pedobacter sp.]MDQ8053801.1 hypothetical protein [Pedobacter sp.]
MKTNFSALRSIVIVGALLFPLNLLAQNDVGDLFKSSPQNATKLVDAYFKPLFKGTGQGFATGWNNSAKAQGLLRFELRVTGTLALVPDEDKFYNTNTLGLSNIRPAAGSNGIGPSVFGGSGSGSKMEFYTSGGTATGKTFNLPNASGFRPAPAAQLQLTVGLPKHIDVSLRAIPSVTFGDHTIGQFGVGAKIELLPLFMGKVEKVMPIDIAVAGGFTNTNYKIKLDVNNGKYTDQRAELKFKGFSTEAIISKKIAFFTPFASVGYISSNSGLNAYGTYEFETEGASTTLTDPIAIKHDDVSAFQGSIGFQVKLGFLRVYGAYTQSKYSSFNGGLGVGFGK